MVCSAAPALSLPPAKSVEDGMNALAKRQTVTVRRIRAPVMRVKFPPLKTRPHQFDLEWRWLLIPAATVLIAVAFRAWVLENENPKNPVGRVWVVDQLLDPPPVRTRWQSDIRRRPLLQTNRRLPSITEVASGRVTMVYVQQQQRAGGWVDTGETFDREVAMGRYRVFAASRERTRLIERIERFATSRERTRRLIERTERVLAEGPPKRGK